MINGTEMGLNGKPGPAQFISNDLREMFITVIDTYLATIVNVFGIITNIITIIVFNRQGYSDVINVCLQGLAIADLGGLIFSMWSVVLSIPWLAYSDNIYFDVIEIQYFTVAPPRWYFTKTAHWITVSITVQRCLCIAMPHKVKSLVVFSRVAVYVVSTYLMMTFVVLIVNVGFRPGYYGWKFYPSKNRTRVGLLYYNNYKETLRIDNVILASANLVFFATITVCTAILVYLIKMTTQKRKEMVHVRDKNSEHFSRRDQRMALMVSTLAILVMATSLPNTFCASLGLTLPGYSLTGEQSNLYVVTWKFAIFCENLNAGIGLIVYYMSSTKFRTTLNQLLRPSKLEK